MAVRTRTGLVLRQVSRDRPRLAFVLLAIGLSWAWWIPVALAGGTASHFPGLLGPLVAASLVTAATGGRAGLRGLLGRAGTPRWWLLAVSPLLVGGLAVAILGSPARDRPGRRSPS